MAVFALIMATLGGASAQPNTDPATVLRANVGDPGLWTMRSKHLIWGMPRQTDNRNHRKDVQDYSPFFAFSTFSRAVRRSMGMDGSFRRQSKKRSGCRSM